jgi:Methyltransferase FkbM domain
MPSAQCGVWKPLARGVEGLLFADPVGRYTPQRKTELGNIAQCAFAEAVTRLGQVDLLKLDCEGAEWAILSDPAPWRSVRSLVMEYHLWAKPNSTTQELETALRYHGFAHIDIKPSRSGPWGLTFAQKR